VVLTTVNHLNTYVFKLTLRGATGFDETLGVTGYHKFYSEAHNCWESVDELKLGEVLRGDNGHDVIVENVVRDPGVYRVYNMSVEADHVYFVGGLDTLTHNNNCALRTALKEAGVYGNVGDQAAHIVPQAGFQYTAEITEKCNQARDVLKLWNIDLNSYWNGFRAAAGHLGTHSKEYIFEMTQRLVAASAGGRVSVLRELQSLRFDILSGKYL